MIFMPKQYPRELRERAVRLVIEHRGGYETEYAAIRSIAAKLGIATPETLRQWVRKAEVDSGQRPGVSSEESAEIRRLRAEVKELRRANEILRAASAFFAAELDRPLMRS
jgi:transposase